MAQLSKKGKEKFKGMNENKFRKLTHQIMGDLEKLQYGGSTYSKFEKEIIKENDKIMELFISFLEGKVNNQSLELYNFYCEYFLDEFRYYYGKTIQTLNEVDLINVLFDRFPRKMMMPFEEKKLALKAVKVLFQYLNTQNFIDENIYRFVRLLANQQKFFEKRLTKPASSEFWNVSISWKNELNNFEEKRLGLQYYVYGDFLKPREYIGGLESTLTSYLVNEQIKIWRKLRWNATTKSKLNSELSKFVIEWYTTPQKILKNLPPLDWIIMERKFSKSLKFP